MRALAALATVQGVRRFSPCSREADAVNGNCGRACPVKEKEWNAMLMGISNILEKPEQATYVHLLTPGFLMLAGSVAYIVARQFDLDPFQKKKVVALANDPDVQQMATTVAIYGGNKFIDTVCEKIKERNPFSGLIAKWIPRREEIAYPALYTAVKACDAAAVGFAAMSRMKLYKSWMTEDDLIMSLCTIGFENKKIVPCLDLLFDLGILKRDVSYKPPRIIFMEEIIVESQNAALMWRIIEALEVRREACRKKQAERKKGSTKETADGANEELQPAATPSLGEMTNENQGLSS